MRFLFLALDVDLDRQAGDAIHVRELVRNLAALGHVADVLAESKTSAMDRTPNDELKTCVAGPIRLHGAANTGG